ncbi:cupin domain-containing protein [Anaerosporobacter faecicola]|uniref:cupin domain-containing protein n=1 Tax=Anaerosporobacter faecicola TaxID=2718714 RepID=UPI001438982D|nr:cupin domain-containing protein [Anaerosporobacter faecicola]
MSEITINQNKENYSVCNIGELEQIKDFAFRHPLLTEKMKGKVFVGEALHTTSMEISVQCLPAGEEIPFDHKHRTHEEVYVIIKGKAEFIIDGEVNEVEEGSFVRIAPDANRRFRNPYKQDLLVMVIQAVAGTLKQHTVFDGYVEK